MNHEPNEKLIEAVRNARVGEVINPCLLPYQKFCKEYGVELAGMQSSDMVDESPLAIFDHESGSIHLRLMNTFLLCHELAHVVQFAYQKETYLLAVSEPSVFQKIAYAENEIVADLVACCLANPEDVILEAVEEYMRIWNDSLGRFPKWEVQAEILMPQVEEIVDIILDFETKSD